VNPTDPLAQLRDIHLPEAISWWPLAFGWWLIAIICLMAMFLSLRYLIKTFFNRRYRRQALVQLELLPNSNQHQRLTGLFNLLKQVASSAYPQQNFASLSHRDFVEFLQSSYPRSMFNDLPDNWEQLFYTQQPSISSQLVDQLISQSRQWIKHHPRAEKLEYKNPC
jgi:hypothetical protein